MATVPILYVLNFGRGKTELNLESLLSTVYTKMTDI